MFHSDFPSFQQDTNLKMQRIRQSTLEITESITPSVHNRLCELIQQDNTLESVLEAVFSLCQLRQTQLGVQRNLTLSCIDLVSEWMDRYQSLHSHIVEYEESKEREEDQMRGFIEEYSLAVNKLIRKNNCLEVEVSEMSSLKEHYHRLYSEEKEIKHTSLCLQEVTQTLDSQLSRWQQQLSSGKDIMQEIAWLRNQNSNLIKEATSLKMSLRKRSSEEESDHNLSFTITIKEDGWEQTKTDRSHLGEEKKETLATEMLEMESNLCTDSKETELFSCWAQSQVPDSLPKEPLSRKRQGRIVTTTKKQEAKQASAAQPLMWRLLKGFLHRFIHDRIVRA